MHMHSEWSDGSVPIEEMIAAAQARGYEYVALTDHSGGIGVANGLSAERLLQQIQEVRVLAARFPGIRIFAGSEVDIKRDGSLDFPDEILAQLDWVIASVHSGFNQPRDEMTARIIAALESPHVNLLAHPTGRLIGKRAAYDVDLEAVFRAAARTNPEVVCSVHLGLLRGTLSRLGAPPTAAGLVPFVQPELCLAQLTPTG